MSNGYTCAMDRLHAARLSANLMALSDVQFAEKLATAASAFGTTLIQVLLSEATRRLNRQAPGAEEGGER